MASTILQKFNIVRFQRPELIPDIEQFLPVSIFKMATTMPQKIQHCSISKVAFDLFFKPVVSGRFGRLETIFVAILKMATAKIFSMLGINSGHHNLPTYEMSLISDNVEFVRYWGGHFENGDC
jgi:hypothetical protein